MQRSKTAPKGAALYLAQVIVTRADLFNDYHGQRLAPSCSAWPTTRPQRWRSPSCPPPVTAAPW